ncbi:MAG: hypothetical protein WC770_03925 [Phycisphaerae bacterium]
MSMASKFLNWLYKRSPHNAADPNPSATPYDQDANIPRNESRPIEMAIEQDVIIGLPLSFEDEDTIARGTNGELIRSHKKISILCGCGHIASQLHAENEAGKSPKRGIAGKCLYCEKEFQKMLKKGLISEIEHERQSLVCTDCAKLAISGILCCPRHYAAIGDENGNIVYLDPDEQAKQSRKDIQKQILMPFATLFIKQNQPKPPSSSDINEQKD